MRPRFIFPLLLTPFFLSCAGPGSGILVQFNGTKPLDQSQLERYCDFEDSTACLLLGKPTENLPKVPLIQGVAPEGRAIFAALLRSEQKLAWYSREPGSLNLKPLQNYQSQSRPHSAFRVEQLQAHELSTGKTYELLGVNQLGQLVDHRTFQTLAPNGPLRFALLSATNDHATPDDLWADLARQKPHLIFALGNNVYANFRGPALLANPASPEQLWERYVETRLKLPIFFQDHLIPVFATWNDRDFGMIDGHKNYRGLEEARRTMEAFFPNLVDTKSVIEGPGISQGVKLAGQTFLLLDNRSFRTPAHTDEPAYFGRIQEDWVLTLLTGQGGTFWLLSGEKWFGKKSDSFERSHPGPFVNFLAKLTQALKKNKKNPPFPIFASGSLSRAEIRKIPAFSTYEFSSGFQRPAGEEKSRDPQILASSEGGYLIVETGESELKAQIRGSAGSIAEKTVALKNRNR